MRGSRVCSPRTDSGGPAISFAVPKRKIAALLRLIEGEPREVSIFLGEAIPGYRGPERPSDLLAAAEFLPVISREGSLRIVQRSAVVSLTVPMEVELAAGGLGAEDLAGDQATSRKLEIHLRNGPPLRGTVVYLMPEGQRRVQDYLNQPDPFVPLRDGTTVHIVRKGAILEIVEL